MGRVSGLRVGLLCVAAGLQTWAGVKGELVLLVTLTRHGSRAPNIVIDELCPNDEDNRAKYNVPPGQLTENGMEQGLKLGTFLRETYVERTGFLPATLGNGGDSSFSSKFMSDSAERCLQTAQAMGMGLFPNGTGPPGFPNQPVPVQTEQKQFANLLAAAHGACLPQQKADNAAYDATRGKNLIEQSKSITDTIAEACGTPTADYPNANNGKEGLVLAVKDVADMLDFDEQQGLPRLGSVSKKAHEDMTQLAFTLLQERYYSNRRQITYWAGDFPSTLVDDLKAAAKKHGEGHKPKRLYLGYHGHRELLYGVAHLLGWSFDVPGAPTALGTSSIPPATTMLFELHFHTEHKEKEDKTPDTEKAALEDPGDARRLHPEGDTNTKTASQEDQQEDERQGESGYYYVRTYAWTPDFGQQEVVLDACSGADAGEGCPLTTVEAIVLDSIKDTGSWQDICHYVPYKEAETMAQKFVFDASEDAKIPRVSSSATALPDGGSGNPFIRSMTVLGVVAFVALVGYVAWLGVVAAKAKWQGAGGRGGEAYQSVP
eukprot:g5969.t1